MTWLTPAHEAWERRFGAGTCPHGKMAKALAPLRPHHTPERIAAHLDGYLASMQGREPFMNLHTFASTFASWAPTATGPALDQGWMTDAFERATRP